MRLHSAHRAAVCAVRQSSAAETVTSCPQTAESSPSTTGRATAWATSPDRPRAGPEAPGSRPIDATCVPITKGLAVIGPGWVPQVSGR
jgi:hypothetical protein